jgi:hypothetical protein
MLLPGVDGLLGRRRSVHPFKLRYLVQRVPPLSKALSRGLSTCLTFGHGRGQARRAASSPAT